MQSIPCIFCVFLHILRFFSNHKDHCPISGGGLFFFFALFAMKNTTTRRRGASPGCAKSRFRAVFGYVFDNKHFTTSLLTNASKSTSLELTENKDNSLSGIFPNSAFYFTWLNNTFCRLEQQFRHLPQTNYPYHRKAVAPRLFDF